MLTASNKHYINGIFTVSGSLNLNNNGGESFRVGREIFPLTPINRV